MQALIRQGEGALNLLYKHIVGKTLPASKHDESCPEGADRDAIGNNLRHSDAGQLGPVKVKLHFLQGSRPPPWEAQSCLRYDNCMLYSS